MDTPGSLPLPPLPAHQHPPFPGSGPPPLAQDWRLRPVTEVTVALALVLWGVLVAGIGAWVVTHGIGSWRGIAGGVIAWPSGWVVNAVMVLPTALAFVLALVVIGRSATRVGLAVGVYGVQLLLVQGALLLVTHQPASLGTSVRSLGLLLEGLSPGATALVLLAWGIARRQGRLWLLGLLPAVAIAWLADRVLALLAPHVIGTDIDAYARLAMLGSLVGLTATMLGGACCWVLEVVERRVQRISGPAGAPAPSAGPQADGPPRPGAPA